MSFGKKTPVYEPVNRDMLPLIGEHFPNLNQCTLEDIFDILTDELHTETLLFVAVAGTLSRYLAGEKDDAGFGFGPGIRLTAINNDESGKKQTHVMELLHDVIVELPMAGWNYKKLQRYLASKFHATIVLYHSCGNAIVDINNEEVFYQACAKEQTLRTYLDWAGTNEKNSSSTDLLHSCKYTNRDLEVAGECFSVAMDAVRRSGHLSKESVVEFV